MGVRSILRDCPVIDGLLGNPGNKKYANIREVALSMNDGLKCRWLDPVDFAARPGNVTYTIVRNIDIF
ncbi:UNVERIFIED_CONTAM: hypothetical protein PYX00_005283 [Menopon gallinae]|uniref:Uncharacterized protein n=1 Tax=Menopon gallinae TaxID=328185 RepID=A0AAW2HQN5_9NEOP